MTAAALSEFKVQAAEMANRLKQARSDKERERARLARVAKCEIDESDPREHLNSDHA